MKIRILPLAIRDLAHGQRFYGRQAAGLHQKFHGYFRALSKRFPYAIYYKIEGEFADVWRVLDCRQNPARITQGLKSAAPPSAEDKAT